MTDNDEKTIYFNRQAKQKITAKADGTAEVQSGVTTIHTGRSGDPSKIALKQLRSVCFRNIMELEFYAISRVDGVTIHHFEFSSEAGGVFAYDPFGAVIDFSIKGACYLQVSNEGDVSLSKFPHPTYPATLHSPGKLVS